MARARPATVKFVLIPADTSQPMQQLEVEQPEGKEVECLTNWMQQYYRNQGHVASEEGKEAFRKQLSDKMPVEMITDEMLSGAYGMQLVESLLTLSLAWVFAQMRSRSSMLQKLCQPWNIFGPNASHIATSNLKISC